jgi:hypothetical protein
MSAACVGGLLAPTKFLVAFGGISVTGLRFGIALSDTLSAQ